MLYTAFDNLSDARRAQGKRYDLKHIALFSVLAIMSGARSYRDLSRFMEAHHQRLCKDFLLKWKSPPAHHTIRRILLSISEKELESSFRAYAAKYIEKQSDTHIAFDGKALCGSFDDFNDKPFFQMLCGYAVNESLILAHHPIAEKTGEITAFAELVKSLDLKDVWITADAIHCQKKL